MSTAADQVWQSPLGAVRLQRYPQRRRELLQAWNQADELLLSAAANRGITAERILVVNDEHGALAVPLGKVWSWTDSALSAIATGINAELNNPSGAPQMLPLDAALPAADLVLLKLPKHKRLLQWQLQQLREQLAPGTPVISAGMQKHVPNDTLQVLEDFLGPSTRNPAQRKARSFESRTAPELTTSVPVLTRYQAPDLSHELAAWPGVFSGDHLDVGTRFMLEQLPDLSGHENCVDLACGNGVIGLSVAARAPLQRITFVDESSLAVQSARHNALHHGLEGAEFLHGDGLLNWAGPAPDLVLCNPPFHQQHTVDDYVGQRLIRQVSETLAAGGELWLVANRHLSYQKTLPQLFDHVKAEAQSQKFTLWRASRSSS